MFVLSCVVLCVYERGRRRRKRTSNSTVSFPRLRRRDLRHQGWGAAGGWLAVLAGGRMSLAEMREAERQRRRWRREDLFLFLASVTGIESGVFSRKAAVGG